MLHKSKMTISELHNSKEKPIEESKRKYSKNEIKCKS